MARTLARFYMWKRISSERHPSLGLVTFTAALPHIEQRFVLRGNAVVMPVSLSIDPLNSGKCRPDIFWIFVQVAKWHHDFSKCIHRKLVLLMKCWNRQKNESCATAAKSAPFRIMEHRA